jgi:tetratricopeptide (TPR) repeat protein
MSVVDDRGCAVSGAAPAALQSYERALAALLAWRSGANAPLALALEQAPGFVMAHALQAYLLVCTRDPQRVRLARAVLARAAALPANERERLHLAAIAAVVGDDYERAKARLSQVLRLDPRDVLALHVAHGFDYITDDVVGMNRRLEDVLPSWSSALPGHHAVLSMHAFALEESGEFERAEETAHAALALNGFDGRAHHVMAHVFEMTDRPRAGVRWMREHADRWSVDTVVATHGHWHVALFHLADGRVDLALEAYDRKVRFSRSSEVADLIDASALLWRVGLQHGETRSRWAELAAAWEPHIDDRFCSFSDLHAMLAFVGACDAARSQRLERVLGASALQATRHGETTRLFGLPGCRALHAFGRGDDGLAITLLSSLPARAQRLGGSHAQRDVFALTIRSALDRLCRPEARAGDAPSWTRAAAVAGVRSRVRARVDATRVSSMRHLGVTAAVAGGAAVCALAIVASAPPPQARPAPLEIGSPVSAPSDQGVVPRGRKFSSSVGISSLTVG